MKPNKDLNRREFFKRSGNYLSSAAISASVPNILQKKGSGKKPNVILIMTDQMRGDALSCLRSPNARTPNLDKMAEEGVIFENAFCNNPVCVPSRISTFTGLYPHQHGALNNTGPFLNTLENTLFDLFRKQGYKTGFIGKNHMVKTGDSELKKYLDYYKFLDRESFRKYSKFVTPFWHCDTYEPSEKCYTTTHTDDSIEFINKADQPFFLYLSYFDPHPPYMAPSEYTSRFSSKDMKIPEYIAAKDLSKRLDEFYRGMKLDEIKDSDLTETFRYYYASITYIDDMVGRVINNLKQNGILDNTIVIFSSDHGDFMGEHRMVRKGIFHYDSLLHVPMIWYAPGLIKKRFRVRNLAQSVDFFPTIANFLNLEIPKSLPGRSLKPILEGQSRIDENHTIFASGRFGEVPGYILNNGKIPEKLKDIPLHTRVQDGFGRSTGKTTAMIRDLNWKFIQTEGHPSELYKMDGGWIERENLAQKSEYVNLVSSFQKKITEIWQ